MRKDKDIKFLQSKNDFPCAVTLGRITPTFGLNRFKQGLRFIPNDDEGFALRGDKRHLLYKGRRRSHRFTILGDKSFEYDCILLKEPESNVISLKMEGAENFDFFRQPDFVKEPLLKGSYAVYKKETIIGEGTGKLCHIHRPEIIDARGRRCWGELAVVGNELHITIPEWWLAEAEYPVVVDPMVGTSTVGSLILGEDPNNSYYDRPYLDGGYAMNKYLVPQNSMGNNFKAFVYYNRDDESMFGYYIYPCLFSNQNNEPHIRKCMWDKSLDISEQYPEDPPNWHSEDFNMIGDLTEGEYVWFGFQASIFATRFDYGGECYKGCFSYDYEEEEELWDLMENPPPVFIKAEYDVFCDIRWSWYFTYEALARNFVRTITNGVTLSDVKRLTVNYKRSLTQTAGVSSLLGRFGNFYRKATDFLNGTDTQEVSIIYVRSVNENVRITDIFSHWGAFVRGLRSNAGSIAETTHKANYYRVNRDTVKTFGVGLRSLFAFVRIVTKIIFRDYVLRRFLVAREECVLKSPICLEIKLDSKI